MAAQVSLPSSTSLSLALVQPLAAEKLATWHLNGQVWRGPLSLETYKRKEEFLSNQEFTRNGGMTFWILVDASVSPSSARRVLSSCETLKKRALVVRRDGKVDEVVSHGIMSVFCDPELRGRGYAGRMMEEFGKVLHTWQQEDNRKADFTVLFSDIGKQFYARFVWKGCSSRHIGLSPAIPEQINARDLSLPAFQPLHASSLASLCRVDEELLKSNLKAQPSRYEKMWMAFVPEIQVIRWHIAREEFVVQDLYGNVPQVKGAIVEEPQGRRVWCIWTHALGNSKAENVLQVLRLVDECQGELGRDESPVDHDETKPSDLRTYQIRAIASVLYAAKQEAYEWEMQGVQLWNPTSLTILAVQKLESFAAVIDRETESIASLKWYNDQPGERAVEWIANEKFGWYSRLFTLITYSILAFVIYSSIKTIPLLEDRLTSATDKALHPSP